MTREGRRYRKSFDKAVELVNLAGVYMEDGALFTAAKRLKEASEEMEKAATIRQDFLTK